MVNKEKGLGIDPYGMKNINFSCELSETDSRKEEYKKQRIERGFDDTELWNLDLTILRFILPRLKAFKDIAVGTPSGFKNEDEWIECIDRMIKSIESIIEDDENADWEGFELFKKHFFDLWW